MLVPPKIMKLASIADSTNSRYALGGVRFERDNTGRPYAIATDGCRLARVTWDEMDPQDYPVEAGLSPSGVNGFEVVLSAKDCAEAAKLAPRRSAKPILGQVVIEEASANGKVTYGATDLDRTRKVEALVLDGKFPMWRPYADDGAPERVLKAPEYNQEPEPVTLKPDGDYVEIQVNPKLMIDLLKLAVELVYDQTESKGITLQVPTNPNQAVRLVKQYDGIDYIAAIMPLGRD